MPKSYKTSSSSGNSLRISFTHNIHAVVTEVKTWTGLGVVGWCDGAGKFPVPGHPTIWITVRQGPSALEVCAGGGCLVIFTLSFLSSLSLSLGDGRI